MNKEEFIKKHGEITESVYNASHSRYLDLLGGKFYTTGFFREGSNPAEDNLPWEKIDYALGLSASFVEALRAGECYALQSEGSASYFPFVYCNGLVDVFPDFIGRDDVMEGAKVVYDELDEWDCIFWDEDPEEEEILELLADLVDDDTDSINKEVYQEVSDAMKENLKNLINFEVIHPKRTEHPVVIGGTDKNGLFVGVITSRVYT